MLSALLPILSPILGDVVKRILPDSDKSADIEREIKVALLDHAESIENMRGNIVLSEAKSDSWITSSWRPLLMMVIVTIVALNYLLFPILNMFTTTQYLIELPDELWNLLQIGVGGYIVGRSGEKMITTFKK
tara:strand:- start:414 stop:809 length:396 start_codon:yes stop_codon:yes gene_type:complete